MSDLCVLEKHLRALRNDGRKALVPYLTGCYPDPVRFVDLMRAVAAAGADAIEVGIPWSDPVIDGAVIQACSQAALEIGVTPPMVLEAVSTAEVPVPVVAMTYVNPVWRMGYRRFAAALAQRGLAGAILPDLPLEEAEPWEEAAAGAGVAGVLLAPPNSTDDRLREIARRSTGFVYGMSLLGVTGERVDPSAFVAAHGDRLRSLTDRPVLIGIGISNGEQAAAVAEHADGVIVGSALVRRVLDGAGPAEVEAFVGELRRALT